MAPPCSVFFVEQIASIGSLLPVAEKMVKHFNRIFKEITDATPAEFRKSAVHKRKDEII